MKVCPFEQLTCPLDALPLSRGEASWFCANGHSFDVAAKGQVNLLPVQHKRSLDPGDHKAMVRSRQRFLNAGYYQPIAEAVNRAALRNRPPTQDISCLDAGCGEGYYLRQLADAREQGSMTVLGVDISKWAILAAAKQDARPGWVVASNAHVPVADKAFDVCLCMFGFPTYTEFARIIKPGGLLLQVDAAADHLRELREVIYSQQKEQRAVNASSPPGFSLAGSESLRYSLQLDDADSIADLLAMTPHYYRAGAEGRRKADALAHIKLTVDVSLSCWHRA